MHRVDLIHIGYHRCASTTLQNDVFAAHPAFALTRDGRLARLPDLSVEDVRFSQIGTTNWDDAKIIVSSEGLCGVGFNMPGPNAAWRLNPVRIHAKWPDAKILIIIRRQPELIRSYYGLALVKWNVTVTPEVYSGEFFPREYLEFDRLIGHYNTLFGRDRVKVLPLEMLSHDGGSFLHELSAFCEVDINGLSLRRLNRSASDGANNAMRILNFGLRIFGERTPKRLPSKSICKVLDRVLPAGQPFFAPGEDEAYLAKFTASNARTSDLIGIDLCGQYGY